MTKSDLPEYITYVFFILMVFSLFFFFSIFVIATFTHFDNTTAELTRDFVIDNSRTIDDLKMHYTYDEVIHLDEVRKVYHNMIYLMIAEFILILSIIGLFMKRFNLYLLNNASRFAFAITVLFFLFASMFYNAAFIIAHKLLFNSVWQFPSDSLLINLFPFNFWFLKSVEVFGITILLSGLVCYFIFQKNIQSKIS